MSDVHSVSEYEASPIHPRFEWLLLVSIVAAGTLLRLHLLTKRDLWVDEAASVVFPQLPWRDFWKALWNAQANMGFYYLLMRGWLHFGDSETVVRGLSVIFGIAVIPATYLLGRRLFGRRAAILSAALSAVNLFQIRYSQEARAYSLVMLLAVLSTYFFLSAIDSPGEKRYWVGYVLASVLGVYTHVFFYLIVAAHWLWLGYARLRLIHPRRTVCWAATGFILLTVPINAFILLKQQAGPDWIPRPTVQELLGFSEFFTGNGGVALVVAYATLCVVAVFGTRTSTEHGAPGFDEPGRVRLVAWWLVFPIASTVLISFFKPLFYDRFMAVSAPALVLLAAKGMVQFNQMFRRPRSVFFLLLAVVIGLSVWGVDRFNKGATSQGDHWRIATRYVLAGQQPGDGVFLYRASGEWPFIYYLHREMKEDDINSSPTIVFPFDPTNPNQEPGSEETSLAVRGRKRVWLILQHYGGRASRKATVNVIQSALLQNFRLSQEQVFPGTSGPITVLLYARTPVPDTQNKP